MSTVIFVGFGSICHSQGVDFPNPPISPTSEAECLAYFSAADAAVQELFHASSACISDAYRHPDSHRTVVAQCNPLTRQAVELSKEKSSELQACRDQVASHKKQEADARKQEEDAKRQAEQTPGATREAVNGAPLAVGEAVDLTSAGAGAGAGADMYADGLVATSPRWEKFSMAFQKFKMVSDYAGLLNDAVTAFTGSPLERWQAGTSLGVAGGESELPPENRRVTEATI